MMNKFVTASGHLTQEVAAVMVGIGAGECGNSLSKAHQWTQDRIYPKEKHDAWQAELDAWVDEIYPKVKALMAGLGFVNGIMPTHTEYDAAIFAGCLTTAAIKRAEAMVNALSSGVTFKNLVVMATEKLNPTRWEKAHSYALQHDLWIIPGGGPKHPEGEKVEEWVQMEWVLRNYIPVTHDRFELILNSRADEDENSFVKYAIPEDPKANTQGCFKYWMQSTGVKSGRLLFFSSQPFANDQLVSCWNAALKAGGDFEIDVCSVEMSGLPPKQTLYGLTRTLNGLVEYRKAKGLVIV